MSAISSPIRRSRREVLGTFEVTGLNTAHNPHQCNEGGSLHRCQWAESSD